MKHKVAKWLASPCQERRLLGESWLLLLGVGSALRCLPVLRVQALLRRVSSRRPRHGGLEVAADRLAWLVSTAARHQVWPVGCLEKSLVLYALLARFGSHPELRIGVRREGEELRAHAWVEVAGKPVGEARDVARHFPTLGGALPE